MWILNKEKGVVVVNSLNNQEMTFLDTTYHFLLIFFKKWIQPYTNNYPWVHLTF